MQRAALRRESCIVAIEDLDDEPDGFGSCSASGAAPVVPSAPAQPCNAATRRALAAAAAEARMQQAICFRVLVLGVRLLWGDGGLSFLTVDGCQTRPETLNPKP